MPLNTMGGNWGAFNPRSYQSAGRGWDSNVYRGGQRQQPRGQQQQQPYGGSWQQPSRGQNPWMQQQPYGGPQKGYRMPSGRSGGIGSGGMRAGGSGGSYGSPNWGSGMNRYERETQGNFEKMNQLMQMQQMMGQIYGHDPRFQQGFAQAAQSYLDPAWQGGAGFNPLDVFGHMGTIDSASNRAPNIAFGEGNPWGGSY